MTLLRQQHQAAGPENQIAAENAMRRPREQRPCQPVSQTTANSSARRVSIASARPHEARRALARGRQPAHQERQHHEIVDAENDLEQRQRRQRQQAVGLQQ